MAKLSNAFIDKVDRPASGQVIYFDDRIIGFGLRVTPGGKTFIVQGRVGGRVVRYKIGSHNAWSCQRAEKEAKRILGLMAQGINPNAQKVAQRIAHVTLGDVFSRYKQDKKLRLTTIKIYEGSIRRCLEDWRNRPITEITKDMVLQRHQQISCANGPHGKGEAHANQVMRFLRALINYAADTYEIDGKPIVTENPVKRLTQLRAWNRVRRRQDVIRPHELRDWYQAVLTLPSKTMQDYLILCLFTGLRRTEAAKLQWCNVDLKAKSLRIPPEDAKNHEEHMLPLPDLIHEILSSRTKVPNNPYVFAGDRPGCPIVESKWSVAKVAERSGVKFTLHTLRRTFETTAESLDVSHYALKRLLNHKTTADVTAGYIVVDVERLREPMQKIANEIKRHTGIGEIQCKTLPTMQRGCNGLNPK